jgi:murein L,D-transpeptidase YafK
MIERIARYSRTLCLSGRFMVLLGLFVLCGVQQAAHARQTSASYILVDKSDRQLTLYRRGHVLGKFDISLGANPQGHKRYEGDRRTPEGIYRIDARNPDSDFHLSLRISYPNSHDAAWAHARGLQPGGQIMIHGMPNNFRLPDSDKFSFDWTDGCIAVADDEMEKIWNLVEVGTLIEIRP